MREQPDFARPATAGTHVYILDAMLFDENEGVLNFVNVPEGWTVKPIYLEMRPDGDIECRVELTPP